MSEQAGPRRRLVPALVLVALGLLVAVVVGALSAPGPPEVDVVADAAGVEPPAVPGELVDGGWPEAAAFVADAAARGRPSLVNLFASWCVPCETEMPVLLDAAAAHPEVAFLGVDTKDGRDPGAAFVAELGVDWPVVYDVDAGVLARLGGRGLPVTAVFDAEGVLVEVVQTELDATDVERLLGRVTG